MFQYMWESQQKKLPNFSVNFILIWDNIYKYVIKENMFLILMTSIAIWNKNVVY